MILVLSSDDDFAGVRVAFYYASVDAGADAIGVRIEALVVGVAGGAGQQRSRYRNRPIVIAHGNQFHPGAYDRNGKQPSGNAHCAHPQRFHGAQAR